MLFKKNFRKEDSERTDEFSFPKDSYPIKKDFLDEVVGDDSHDLIKIENKKPFFKRIVSKSLFFIGWGLILIGVFFSLLSILPDESIPENLEYLNNFEQSIDQEIDKAIQKVKYINKDVEITIGASGGKKELDKCDGTFTRYLSYEEAGLKPSFLAHSGCGGSSILYSNVGDFITVNYPDDSVKRYVISEEIIVPKYTSSTSDISNLKGHIYLQSCFLKGNVMRIIGLEEINSNNEVIELKEEGKKSIKDSPLENHNY